MNIWHRLMLGFTLTMTAAGPASALPLEVVTSKPSPPLTKSFQQTSGWTGGDGAYSIPLGPNRTLWLFGDTWVGKIQAGRRVESRMVNNSAAWQSLRHPRAALRFFWGGTDKRPAALLRPVEAGAWYWPGDGALVNGRLYLFCKLVRHQAKGPPGLQFDWFGNDLLCISNPQDRPTAWKSKRCRLFAAAAYPRLGVACWRQGDFLYVYGLFPSRACKPLHSPLALARISRQKLFALNGKGWEFWCQGARGKRWSDRPDDLVPLFVDAAPELSVSRVRGLDGLIATYTSLGLGREIMVRQAARPEGPWDKPVRVYRCPEAGNKLLLYGAKAHPELARKDGQLLITYCRNSGTLAEHVSRPDVYFPQGIEVRLRARAKAQSKRP